MKLTQDQITNLLLKLIACASSAAVAHGWQDTGVWTLLAEAAPGIAAIIYSHFWAAQPPSGSGTTPPPAAGALLLLCLLPSLHGCATLTGTTDPAQQEAAIDQDITDGVRLATATEISNDPNSRQYFVLASEALDTLTANGTPTLTQINAELVKVIPVKYQDVVSSVTQIAADKYQQWYVANQAQITSSQAAKYVVDAIKAASTGVDEALAAAPAPATSIAN